ncbi:hypothetical protein [Streptomyces xanthophaeus]
MNVVVGLVANIAYTLELIYTPLNADCWEDRQEEGGCDPGAQYDEAAVEADVNVNSDEYQIAGLAAVLLAHRPQAINGPVKTPKLRATPGSALGGN